MFWQDNRDEAFLLRMRREATRSEVQANRIALVESSVRYSFFSSGNFSIRI